MDEIINGNRVRVRKSATGWDDSVTLTYSVEPTEPNVGRVRLVERFPEAIPREEIQASQEDGWQYADDGRMVFETRLEGTEPVETSLRVRSNEFDPRECSSAVTATGATNGPPESSRGGLASADVRLAGDGTGVQSNGATHDDPVRSASPVVGLIATEENTGAVARATLTATDHGVPVFVVERAGTETATARIAEAVGAVVIRPSVSAGERDELKARLVDAARARGFSGVIHHDPAERDLSIEESLASFEAAEGPAVESVGRCTNPAVVVGIPAYNEAETIGAVVRAAADWADEVLVVDDGSTDATADRAREAGATVIQNDRNRGYGYSLRTLFVEADDRGVDHLVVLDGDGQHDTADIPRMVDEQRESGAEIVIASRFERDSATDISRYRRFGLWVITVLVNLSMGNLRKRSRVRDPQSGFRAYDSTAIASLSEDNEALEDGMSASIDVLYHAFERNYRIEEVSTTISYNVPDANTHNSVTHGLNVVNNVLKTLERKRPISVLGVPGLLVATAGVLTGYWAVSAFVSADRLSPVVVVLSVVLVLIGFLSAFTSLILHALNIHLEESV